MQAAAHLWYLSTPAHLTLGIMQLVVNGTALEISITYVFIVLLYGCDCPILLHTGVEGRSEAGQEA